MEDPGDSEFQPIRRDVALETYAHDDLEIRQAEQTLRHRDFLIRAVIALYSLTLVATLTLFYLSGLGILSFGDNVLISLSGVVIGELGVGAILMQIVKSIFIDA